MPKISLGGGRYEDIFASLNRIAIKQGTAFSPTIDDMGEVKGLNSASAITVTLPRDLPKGFTVTYSQEGAGQVSFAAGSGATIQSAGAIVAISAQYGIMTAIVWNNPDGNSATWRLV